MKSEVRKLSKVGCVSAHYLCRVCSRQASFFPRAPYEGAAFKEGIPSTARGSTVLLIFPYRPQIRLHKLPSVTLLIMVLCLVVYFVQDRNMAQIDRVVERVCAQDEDPKAFVYPLRRYKVHCDWILRYTYFNSDPEAHFRWHREDIARRAGAALAQRYEKLYRAFAAEAPPLYSAYLWHDRPSWNLWRMLTSSIAHASWDHVIFNLLFFFAFAAAVELVIGPVLFLACFVLLAFGIGGFDNIISPWADDPGPTLGLSGVVMGMMTLAMYLIPRAKVRFFKFNVMMVTGVLAGYFYLTVALPLLVLAIYLVENFGVQMLMAAPALAAGYRLYRSRREELDRRLAAYHRDPGVGPPWEEVKQRIQRHG